MLISRTLNQPECTKDGHHDLRLLDAFEDWRKEKSAEGYVWTRLHEIGPYQVLPEAILVRVSQDRVQYYKLNMTPEDYDNKLTHSCSASILR